MSNDVNDAEADAISEAIAAELRGLKGKCKKTTDELAADSGLSKSTVLRLLNNGDSSRRGAVYEPGKIDMLARAMGSSFYEVVDATKGARSASADRSA